MNFMRYEKNRLASYCKRKNYNTSATKLSHAGFFSTGDTDEVECFECCLRIRGWDEMNPREHPLDIHKTRSPDCPFFSEKSTNVPYCYAKSKKCGGKPNSKTQKPTNDIMPHDQAFPMSIGLHWSNGTYYDEQERLNSFRDWPKTFITPEELVKAGFYYLGTEDRVQCFCCKGILKEWQQGETAINEHIRHFPSCQYIRDVIAAKQGSPTIMQKYSIRIETTRRRLCGLEPLFKKLSREADVPEKECMKYEAWRLASFDKLPEEYWYDIPSRSKLAHNGYFYTGKNDEVVCCSCDVLLKQWTKLSVNTYRINVQDLHSDTCSFRRLPNKYNIPISAPTSIAYAKKKRDSPNAGIFAGTGDDIHSLKIPGMEQRTRVCHFSPQKQRSAVVKRAHERNRQKRGEARWVAQIARTRRRLSTELQALQEAKLCRICTQHPFNTALGCGHVLCGGCLNRLRDGRCPFCRVPIAEIQQMAFCCDFIPDCVECLADLELFK